MDIQTIYIYVIMLKPNTKRCSDILARSFRTTFLTLLHINI